MRLGFEAKRAFHNSRGLGNYARTLLEGLFRYFPQEGYFLYSPPSESQLSYDWERELHAFDVNITIRRPESNFGRLVPSLWRRYFQLHDLKRDQLDLYHGLSHELPQHIETAGVASVVTIHDLIFLRFPEQFPWIDRQIYYRKFKHAIEKSTKVLAICEQTKRDILHYFDVPESKVHVLYQSCHPRFYNSFENSYLEEVQRQYSLPRNFILYVGAFEERKNVLSLLKAYAGSYNREEYDLVLVGKGGETYQNRMQELIRDEQIGERVHIYSGVQTEELPAFYQLSSLFVFPSSFEGFGIPIVEALFSGVPVITSKGSCFPETGGPGSSYVDSGDDQALTQEMDRILSDPQVQSEMIQQGHDYVQKFHQKETTHQLMSFYREISSQK